MSVLLRPTPELMTARTKPVRMLNALVVDDEPPARDELVFMLEQCEGVVVTGTADCAAAALDLAAMEPPDVVFCDLRMPGPDGLALAQAFATRTPRPIVVVVSAHDTGARDAFQAGVHDYLAKPVRLERLRTSLARVREALPIADEEATTEPLTRIAVRRRQSYVVLDVADVACFEVEHEIVWARTARDRFALDLRLQALAHRLPPGDFFRSHRSALVRLDRIVGLEPSGAGAYELVLSSPRDHRVPLARERVRSLRERIPFAG